MSFKTYRLNIPIFDKYIGIIRAGNLILIEGKPETYPYLLLYRIGVNISRENIRVTFIMMGDDVEEYREAALNVGLDFRTYERAGIWKHYSIHSSSELTNLILSKIIDSIVLVDATAISLDLNTNELLKIKEQAKTHETFIVIALTPENLSREALMAFEKISNVIIELKSTIISDEVRYSILIKKHKEYPKSGVILSYTIGALGIRIEQLSKIPS